ncbi:MAG: hypothetical protein AAGH45_11655 [Pseudomonadota bacterium]
MKDLLMTVVLFGLFVSGVAGGLYVAYWSMINEAADKEGRGVTKGLLAMLEPESVAKAAKVRAQRDEELKKRPAYTPVRRTEV